MKIGYNSDNYPERRNIINKISDVKYVRVRSYKSILYNLSKKFFKFFNIRDKAIFYFNDLGLNRVSLLHFFNYINYGKTPWVCTFETVLPRNIKANQLIYLEPGSDKALELLNDQTIALGIARIANHHCKKIISLSNCNLKQQLKLLEHFPNYSESIKRKLICIHPPQTRFFNSWHEKGLSLDESIHFMFVGGLFFTKGGREMLDVFCSLKNEGFNIKLIIVSALNTDDYATFTGELDKINIKQIINDNLSWIDYYKFLPNNDVIELMKIVHVGLLPTYADTYGYSVLEFQACGCPVISTNVRALPEINNNEVGWLIDVPKTHLGEGLYSTKELRNQMSISIKTGLQNIVEEIFTDKNVIVKKSNASLRRIEEQHDPTAFAEKIRSIYDQAVES